MLKLYIPKKTLLHSNVKFDCRTYLHRDLSQLVEFLNDLHYFSFHSEALQEFAESELPEHMQDMSDQMANLSLLDEAASDPIASVDTDPIARLADGTTLDEMSGSMAEKIAEKIGTKLDEMTEKIGTKLDEMAEKIVES